MTRPPHPGAGAVMSPPANAVQALDTLRRWPADSVDAPLLHGPTIALTALSSVELEPLGPDDGEACLPPIHARCVV